MSSSEAVQLRIGRGQTRALIVGVVGIVLAIVLGLRNPQQFYHSYLYAFVFWAAIPLGCLGILNLHHLTGGWWGLPIRRIVEAGSRTLPFVFVLFLPVLAGMGKLYLWAQPAAVEADPLLQYKKPYLNPSFFTVRTVIYFAIWILLMFLQNKWSKEQDRTADPALKNRMSSLAGPAFILWAVMVTLAAVDWVMSLEPHWFSTIYGMVFMLIDGLTAMSFAVFVVRRLYDQEPLKDCVEPKRFLDLGNLMLAMLLLLTYMSFDQLLIVWSGNLKTEIPWYTQRVFGGWAPVAAILIVGHFFVPFFLLLQRGVKRRLNVLALVAAWLMVLSMLNIYWHIAPAFDTHAPHFHLLDFLALIGVGGLWVGVFLWQLKKWPLLPLHDPRFEGALEHAHGD